MRGVARGLRTAYRPAQGGADRCRRVRGLAEQQDSPREREFAAIFAAHDRMVRELGACDEGDLVRLATRLLADQPSSRQPFQHVLIDDAQELDLGPATLARAVAGGALTVAGDPLAALWRFRGAGAARLDAFETRGTR